MPVSETTEDTGRSRYGIMRIFWLCIGWGALTLGAIGAVLPLLPTTPFILLAAFAFARSSPRLRRWLVEHRIYGPMILDWERHGAIAPRYKILALSMMGLVLAASLWWRAPGTVLFIQIACMGAAALFILSRPGKAQG